MIIDNQLLDRVSDLAKQSDRLRMNFNLHESLEAKAQRLLNALEVGTYGTSSREKALGLLGKNWYDCVGTDMHNLRFHLKEMENIKLKTIELESLKGLLDSG